MDVSREMPPIFRARPFTSLDLSQSAAANGRASDAVGCRTGHSHVVAGSGLASAEASCRMFRLARRRTVNLWMIRLHPAGLIWVRASAGARGHACGKESRARP
ncbi:hypothetical protein J7I44_02715 [Frateuria sp. MAH-13]|uniref:Uncharacterized protein n=1 Tax=Frateuria flava TaxID=2821489 RepID=A0ABS4DJF7_9GAMM|nr:hypothetical protein [Frateuria flava]MBP1473192.1 hypothetical protein [Frateuria flava]